MSKFGLIGKYIDYSFSRKYFSEKFEKENLPHTYENFDIESIDQFADVISKNPELKGLSVTIPYKEEIIPFLDHLDKEAAQIGAVNTIAISSGNILTGFNTDHYGFQKALAPFLPLNKKTALILGTGGASKAIAYAIEKLGFQYTFVSRKKNSKFLLYSELDKKIIENNLLIINCTPLGTFPNIKDCPPIPYQFLTSDHLLF
ncbi:MAG TPA: hypothetical protein VKX40_14940, partial [Aequorivita sp.]|nr:hypothetical protein [Aequorivita sp.]